MKFALVCWTTLRSSQAPDFERIIDKKVTSKRDIGTGTALAHLIIILLILLVILILLE